MKKLIATFSIILGSLSAIEMPKETQPDANRYGYLNFGVGPLPFPVPTIGGGYRMQSGKHGLDFNASAIIAAPERLAAKLSGHYLRYLTPKWYLGIGPQVSQVFNLNLNWKGIGVSPEILFGRESFGKGKNNRRFWELGIDYPMFFKNDEVYKWDPSDRYVFPYVFVQYGWGF